MGDGSGYVNCTRVSEYYIGMAMPNKNNMLISYSALSSFRIQGSARNHESVYLQKLGFMDSCGTYTN